MGGYSFNSAHSIAYAMLTYQTAYLKAHYPVEFFVHCLIKIKMIMVQLINTLWMQNNLA